MRFSILIPTYTRAHLLDQAIRSALAQTHMHREILVIDDGSTDDVPHVAATFGDSICYLRQENKGKSAALNLGISASEGDAIIVLDDDDLFPPQTLAKHADALARNPGADFSYGQFSRFHGYGPCPSELNDIESVPVRDPRRLVVKLMENSFLPNPTWAVRRAAQMRAGPYDEKMARSQDYDMILRIARTNEGIFVDEVVLHQRKHLSHRGPSSERTYTIDTVEEWIKYDSILFERLDREWTLCDFRPFPGPMNTRGEEASALLQKGVILFRRRVYRGAIRALSEYRRQMRDRRPVPGDLRIATGLLGGRYGIADLVSGEGSGGDLTDEFRAANWPLSMRIAFAYQIGWRFRSALMIGDLRYASKLAQFSRKEFGLAATAAVLGSRYSFGVREWRR